VNAKTKKAELQNVLGVQGEGKKKKTTIEELVARLPAPKTIEWEYLVKINHDESIARCKDDGAMDWGEQGTIHKLRPKTLGRGLMLSDYMSPHDGMLQMSDKSWEEYKQENPEWKESDRYATQAFEYGKNSEGYWTAVELIEQTDRALDIFERNHPKGRAVMGFDSSTNHRAYAPNALVAAHMNVGPGGKQAIMRDGWFIDKKTGKRVAQSMHVNGNAKGLLAVLTERGIKVTDEKGVNFKQEKLTDLMAAEPDFKEQKCLLQEWIERRGHICLFFPKFHPELNAIEMVWSSWKRMLRKLCDGSFESLGANVHIALRAIGLEEIRAYERHCQRYYKAYREGKSGYEAAQLVYKSHRRISANADKIALQ
jgi:transposase